MLQKEMLAKEIIIALISLFWVLYLIDLWAIWLARDEMYR